MKRHWMLAAGLAAAAITGRVLTSGDGGRGPTPLDTPDTPEGQVWALEDGAVTGDEYHTAVDRFLACVRQAGYGTGEPARSPVDGVTLVYDMDRTGDPQAFNNSVQACNLAHVSAIEPAFVESQPQTMDDRLRREVARCLRSKGHAVSGRERNARELAAAAVDGTVVIDCTADALQFLYPGLPSEVTVRI
jgi:hypothetical protein